VKIDLCKLFGVEEGEEFKIEHISCEGLIYKIQDNCLKRRQQDSKNFIISGFGINKINEITNIIKLPKKKKFTYDELCILRNIDKWYKWIARTRGNVITLHNDKPYKDHNIWNSINCEAEINVFNHLFNSIQWKDEEPVFIDDYVER
jgi:hypothetical protein